MFRQERSFASKYSQRKAPEKPKKTFTIPKRKTDQRDIRDIDERLLPVVSVFARLLLHASVKEPLDSSVGI